MEQATSPARVYPAACHPGPMTAAARRVPDLTRCTPAAHSGRRLAPAGPRGTASATLALGLATAPARPGDCRCGPFRPPARQTTGGQSRPGRVDAIQKRSRQRSHCRSPGRCRTGSDVDGSTRPRWTLDVLPARFLRYTGTGVDLRLLRVGGDPPGRPDASPARRGQVGVDDSPDPHAIRRTELVNRRGSAPAEACTASFRWIAWYNQRRRHSSNDYLPPVRWEQQHAELSQIDSITDSRIATVSGQRGKSTSAPASASG